MLGPLYAKAALGALRRRGRDLPDTVVVREGVAVDAGRLAAYARVCGFALDGALPPTYPHLLGFEPQLRLMADRAFPLALPGLVHIRNTISVDRRIEVGERLRVRVHAERHAAHPKGAQVDLLTEVVADDSSVWRGRSTYLARGPIAPTAAFTYSGAKLIARPRCARPRLRRNAVSMMRSHARAWLRPRSGSGRTRARPGR